MKIHSLKQGVVLVEVVIVAAILLILSTSLIFANVAYIQSASYSLASTKATLLAQECVESMKYIRSNGWDASIDSLAEGATYYLYFTPTNWTSTTTEEVIDGKFYRSFVLGEVERDINDDITSSGTVDDNTKLLTCDVSWQGTVGTTTRSVSTYLTNFLE